MPDFDYLALDTGGRERRGSVAAPTIEDARERLDRRRLYVVKIEPGTGAPPKGPALLSSGLFARRRMSMKALTLFTRQLATLIQVSPLEESLRTIARQTEKAQVRAVLDRVHGGVVEGRRLSEAMGREPKSFPPLYRAMVSAGEGSGTLPSILERQAELLERQAQMRSKVMSALAYPTVLAVVATGVVMALMIFVVPQVVEQFDDPRVKLVRYEDNAGIVGNFTRSRILEDAGDLRDVGHDFPGPYAAYLGIYTRHGVKYDRKPLSMADAHRLHGAGHGAAPPAAAAPPTHRHR